MQLVGDAVTTGVFESKKKPGRMYYQFTDLGTGGSFSLSFDGVIDVKPGDIVKMNAVIKPRSYAGNISLEFVSGSIARNGH